MIHVMNRKRAETVIRKARVQVPSTTPLHRFVKQVDAYLPSNYQIVATTDTHLIVAGSDDHGWTLDGYVIPRLASGLIVAEEVSPLRTP